MTQDEPLYTRLRRLYRKMERLRNTSYFKEDINSIKLSNFFMNIFSSSGEQMDIISELKKVEVKLTDTYFKNLFRELIKLGDLHTLLGPTLKKFIGMPDEEIKKILAEGLLNKKLSEYDLLTFAETILQYGIIKKWHPPKEDNWCIAKRLIQIVVDVAEKNKLHILPQVEEIENQVEEIK